MNLLDETAANLDAVIKQWRVKLLALDEAVVREKSDPDRWSISEVIGHLIDSACNNHQRFVRAQHSPSLEFPKYEQNQWVAAANYHTFAWESLVDLWFNYNQLLVHLLRNMPESDLPTQCTITPYPACTLGHLVTDYLAHTNHHLQILASRIDQ